MTMIDFEPYVEPMAKIMAEALGHDWDDLADNDDELERRQREEWRENPRSREHFRAKARDVLMRLMEEEP